MTVVCTGPFMKEICSEGGVEEIKELPDFAEKTYRDRVKSVHQVW